MNLIRLNANKKGFSESMSVGEIVEFEKTKYVVIEIYEANLYTFRNAMVGCRFIAQPIGTRIDVSGWEQFFTFTERFNVAKNEKPIRKAGDITSDQDDVLIRIIGIENFKYEFTDLIITYQAEIIQPWSKYQMDEAVKRNRLSTFKVVSHSKGE